METAAVEGQNRGRLEQTTGMGRNERVGENAWGGQGG